MGNINPHLIWRGDLDFAERLFCAADNLALAILSYLDLGRIVPADGSEISIKAAYEQYQSADIHQSVRKHMSGIRIPNKGSRSCTRFQSY